MFCVKGCVGRVRTSRNTVSLVTGTRGAKTATGPRAATKAATANDGPFFPTVKKIEYEGPDSKNPLAFKWYNPSEVIEGKTMKDHLRFSVVYWHTMRFTGSDPFGSKTLFRPWDDGTESLNVAKRRVRVMFELLEKLQCPFYAFHDRDVAPESEKLSRTNSNLWRIHDVLKQEQDRTGIQLLWGTANLFSHPRYMHGAGTSPELDVFAHAGAQIKEAMDVTHSLGGHGYVFWGGREGYQTLLNTNMSRELDHMAALLEMAAKYKKRIGFKGALYIEPKPREPTKHQYDSDAEACLNFLRKYKLLDDFKLNIETNHATLAGHEMVHELEIAGASGALGSIDANRGDELLGWDTDQFPTNLYLTAHVMYTLLKYGGLTTGGVNFDAKVRRESVDPVDLFHGHIGGMDTFARGLRVAAAMRKDGQLEELLNKRYSSWDSDLGKKIESGKSTLWEMARHVKSKGSKVPLPPSGRQELLENIVNSFIK